jgi:methylenetetrahydrofolate dehydrogenase (NADP+)/methenyltetrahydrofolate cyclohydrolase
MGATILDGRALAAQLRERLIVEAARFAAERQRYARLALVLVGDNPTATLYTQQVERAGRRIGVDVSIRSFESAVSELALRLEVAALGARGDVDGVAVALPLPSHIRQRIVMEILPASKDVDGLGPQNAGRLMLGFPSFVPSTADAALELLRQARITLQGRDTVVVGRSNVGGKPAALLFLRENATVTLCHSQTRDLAAITSQADILFTSAGQAGVITRDMLKPGSVVLDAGMAQVGGSILGDVEEQGARAVAGYLTPTPGGLGPLTPLMLLRHTLIGPT